MADQAAKSIDSNTIVGTSSNARINVETSANTNMAMVTQPQEQGVPYGYDGYQYCYPDPYMFGSAYGYPHAPHAPHYPYAENMVANTNVLDGYNLYGNTLPYYYYGYNLYGNQGYDNHLYENPGAYQFQPGTPQAQHHSSHQQLQSQQPGRFETMKGQRSQSVSRTGAEVVQQRQSQQPGRFETMKGQRSQSVSGTGAEVVQQLQSQQPGRFETMKGQRSQSVSGTGAEVVQDEYNLPGFITRYANAKFFVIKCDNSKHVMNSIRHGVWTSTYRGNRKLNAVYAEATSGEQRVQGDTSSASSSNCPIFLLFSVNKSSHFCGVAEMVGPVDFKARTNLREWQDKFPVKWHIIKDVPFSEIAHITMEINENRSRSIISSRDTQQVEKEKGEEMLDIFKNYAGTSSLLDLIAWERRRRQGVLGRKLPSKSSSAQHKHDHEQQQVEEEEAAGSSCNSRSHKNSKQEDETGNNTKEEEIDHNALESECEQSQEAQSTVISVGSHNTSNNTKNKEEKL